MQRDHPHVYFPPPLLFVAGFLVGLALQRLWPLGLFLPTSIFLFALAWALVGAGLLLVGWALWTFWRARTGILPHRPASELLARGPYAFSRNPMYVALALLYVGMALWAGTSWPILLLPAVLWTLGRVVIRREEAYLSRAFGEAYAIYKTRVRRWL